VSPILANLFLHYAFDRWVTRHLPGVRFARYADDAVLHCKSKRQAEYVLDRIRERFQACKLELHPGKTRIVYCKDINRTGDHPDIQFTCGWRNKSFRGYADYMQTDQFAAALQALVGMSHQGRLAIMCAEAVPWRCHRSLVADALNIRGIPVVEILSEEDYRMHQLTSFACVEGLQITYPPEQATLL
jgi:hypothetical protein